MTDGAQSITPVRRLRAKSLQVETRGTTKQAASGTARCSLARGTTSIVMLA